MKKLGTFALLLSLGMFTLGCEKPKDGGDAATDDAATEAPADDGGDAGDAGDDTTE